MKLIISLSILFFHTLCLNAQEIEYKNITNEMGLSNSSITSICQDSNKIMWFGTWDGLNSFDGKRFKTYRSTANPNSISNNVIRNIIEQHKGILWISTDHGISKMDVEQSCFKRFLFGYDKINPALPEIYSIAKSSNNVLFAAVLGWGLSYYDENIQDFSKLEIPYIETNNIKQMTIDSKDRMWILHLNGTLEVFDWHINNEGMFSISNEETMENKHISSICTDKEYTLALDYANTIHVYSTTTPTYDAIEYKSILGNKSLKGVKIIKNNIYLVPFSGGYYSKSLNTQSDFEYNDLFEDVNITTLFLGDQNILWVGTDGSGIFMQYEKDKLFNTVNLGEKGMNVRAIVEDRDQNLWIGTKGNGVYVMNNNFKEPTIIKHFDTSNGLSNNSVYVISKYNDIDLFLGSDATGLDVYANNRLSKLNLNKVENEIENFRNVYSIFPTEKDSTIWIGTSGYGLIRLKVQKINGGYEAIAAKQYTYNKGDAKSISNNVIYSIIQDTDGYLWIGTRGGGLNRLNIEKEEFDHFVHNTTNTQSLSGNDVLEIAKDSKGNLWVGTSSGLNKLCFDGDSIHYSQYDKELPNNTIHGIIEDDRGNIWVSTSLGLGKINIVNDQITSYYAHDGLQNNEFSDGAYYKSTSNGHLFFGGIAGFNMFDPNKIKTRPYIPTFYCSSFNVFNKSINLASRLKNGALVLDHDENFFGFDFQSVDYIQNENCEYRYRLKGFDKDWISNRNSGHISYTNVDPGRYTLQVSYTNGDKVWIATPFSLDIKIQPPLWGTNFAYIAYILLSVILVYAVYRWIRRRIELNQQIFLNAQEKIEQENIHEAKLLFFTNIAHELSTPITLIYGPSERIIEYAKGDEYITRYATLIKSNAERMKELIGELMEFRKVKTGHVNVSTQRINISQLLNHLCNYFTELVEENQIDFTVDLPEQEILWVSDNSCVEKIFYNLISNAFKYTPSSGYINISASIIDNKLRFVITNSGKGIREEDIDVIFDRFRILNEFEDKIQKGNASRNGIGLALSKSFVELLKGTISVESELNSHTTFIVSLPMQEINEVAKPQTCSVDIKEGHSHISQQLPAGAGGAPLIMLVDDQAEIRELLYDTLCKRYPNIMQASDGREALEMMKTKRPNLIICDIMMPNMDGIELIKELKENVLTGHIPVIFLSAKSSIEDQILATQHGSDVYISKPFHPNHILVAVDNILLKHNLIKEYYNSSATAFELLENGKMMHKDNVDFLLELTQYIEQNMAHQDLTIDSICARMNISSISLYRKLKLLTEQTPSSFIKEIKLNTACRLLKTTNLTVQEVMFQCGFNNKSYFHREFKKVHNTTPMEYRELWQ